MVCEFRFNVILESKFADDLLNPANSRLFYYMKKHVKSEIFYWMLDRLTEGWYLCCCGYRRGYHNVYANTEN